MKENAKKQQLVAALDGYAVKPKWSTGQPLEIMHSCIFKEPAEWHCKRRR